MFHSLCGPSVAISNDEQCWSVVKLSVCEGAKCDKRPVVFIELIKLEWPLIINFFLLLFALNLVVFTSKAFLLFFWLFRMQKLYQAKTMWYPIFGFSLEIDLNLSFDSISLTIEGMVYQTDFLLFEPVFAIYYFIKWFIYHWERADLINAFFC